MKDIPFEARAVRIGGASQAFTYPHAEVFTSMHDLLVFYETHSDSMGLQAGFNGESFADVMDQYDEAFFTDKAMYLVFLEVGTGSAVTSIEKVQLAGDRVVVQPAVEMPGEGEFGTADMAYWAWFVEVDAAYGTYPAVVA